MTAELITSENTRHHDGTAAPRWEPDPQLIPAILTTPKWPRRLTDYSPADRAWIVAGLTLAGWSAQEIVHRAGGSIRLVRALRAEPFTECCRLWQLDITRLETDLRREQIAHTATHHELTQATRSAERKDRQIDQLVETLRRTRHRAPEPETTTEPEQEPNSRTNPRRHRNGHHPRTRRKRRNRRH